MGNGWWLNAFLKLRISSPLRGRHVFYSRYRAGGVGIVEAYVHIHKRAQRTISNIAIWSTAIAQIKTRRSVRTDVGVSSEVGKLGWCDARNWGGATWCWGELWGGGTYAGDSMDIARRIVNPKSIRIVQAQFPFLDTYMRRLVTRLGTMTPLYINSIDKISSAVSPSPVLLFLDRKVSEIRSGSGHHRVRRQARPVGVYIICQAVRGITSRRK